MAWKGSEELSSENDYSAACLPIYEPQVVNVLNDDNCEGYFVMDRSILGRSWGGLRLAADLTLTEVKILARTMTTKSVLAGVPIGGAKCGIRTRAIGVKTDQVLSLISKLIGRYIRKQSYFLGTDIGFSQKDANHVYELVGSRRRIFSGKLSPGVCCAHSILASIEYVKQMNPKMDAETVALEGFGNMAVLTAKLLVSKGYRVIAVSNIDGTLEDRSNLNIEELAEMADSTQNGFLSRYAHGHPTATFRLGSSINFKVCDILIPGARVFSINETAARMIKTKLVCPIANSPITATAEHVFARRGIVSIPDVISNSGAVIGDFAQQLGANESQTRRIITDIINSNLRNVFLGSCTDRNPKLLAQDAAIQRIRSLDQSERIATLQWLAPWFREFGLPSVFRALKEYLTLRVFGAFPA